MRLRFGQVLLATNSTLSAVLRVRNLADTHISRSNPCFNRNRADSAVQRGGRAIPIDSARLNALWAFKSHSFAPERAHCRSVQLSSNSGLSCEPGLTEAESYGRADGQTTANLFERGTV